MESKLVDTSYVPTDYLHKVESESARAETYRTLAIAFCTALVVVLCVVLPLAVYLK